MLLVSMVTSLATSSTMLLLFTLLQNLAPLRAAPNILSNTQVIIELFHDCQLLYQGDETDEQPTFDFEVTFEGDKVVRVGETPGFECVIANPEKLWPGGVVEYKFYGTFSRCLDTLTSITGSNSQKSPARTGQ